MSDAFYRDLASGNCPYKQNDKIDESNLSNSSTANLSFGTSYDDFLKKYEINYSNKDVCFNNNIVQKLTYNYNVHISLVFNNIDKTIEKQDLPVNTLPQDFVELTVYAFRCFGLKAIDLCEYKLLEKEDRNKSGEDTIVEDKFCPINQHTNFKKVYGSFEGDTNNKYIKIFIYPPSHPDIEQHDKTIKENFENQMQRDSNRHSIKNNYIDLPEKKLTKKNSSMDNLKSNVDKQLDDYLGMKQKLSLHSEALKLMLISDNDSKGNSSLNKAIIPDKDNKRYKCMDKETFSSDTFVESFNSNPECQSKEC